MPDKLLPGKDGGNIIMMIMTNIVLGKPWRGKDSTGKIMIVAMMIMSLRLTLVPI